MDHQSSYKTFQSSEAKQTTIIQHISNTHPPIRQSQQLGKYRLFDQKINEETLKELKTQ